MITSGSNPRIAQLRALHTPKGREAAGMFLIEGPHLLEAALDARVTPRLIVFDPDALARSVEGRRLLERIYEAREAGAEALEATPPAIERASDARTPQGVAAAVALADLAPERVRTRRRGRARPLLLALDALSDPGNMGTILRSALAADVDEALLGPECADPFAPKVVRAGAGAHFHLPIRHGLRWPEVAERFAGAPVAEQVLVAEAAGRVAYDEVDLTRRTALIIGNEAHGVSRQAATLATERISIPMWNKVESLNAGIAASVILFEAARQRRHKERAHDSD
ncbi:MAG TPA: RNA methyltransferase [Ktedonobacterales bacterium]|nr:RNA methyltransferase [Ktedonobacterales bacterium]